jgi:hypothetical protein
VSAQKALDRGIADRRNLSTGCQGKRLAQRCHVVTLRRGRPNCLLGCRWRGRSNRASQRFQFDLNSPLESRAFGCGFLLGGQACRFRLPMRLQVDAFKLP